MRYYTITFWIATFSFILCSCSSNINSEDEIKLFPVVINQNVGYIDHDGKIVINPQFAFGEIFEEHRALVQNEDNLTGFIDEQGRYIVYPQYASATSFSEGLAAVSKPDGPCQYIDSTGKVVLTVDDADEVGMFHDGLAPYSHNGKWGYIDKSGNKVINAQYTAAGRFSDGLACVAMPATNWKESYGYINTKGKFVINCQFRYAKAFHNGMAVVYSGEKCGYINKEGKYVINPQFDYAWDFYNDRAIIRNGDEIGYIDKTGKIVINAQFAAAGDFAANGLASVGMKSGDGLKHGYIDKQGRYVINPQYAAASGFWGDVAFAGDENLMGIIDAKGANKANPQFGATLYNIPGVKWRISNEMAQSQKEGVYYTAMKWLRYFKHINLKGAALYSTPQMTNQLISIEELIVAEDDEYKAEMRNAEIRIWDIQQNGDKAEVVYSISNFSYIRKLLLERSDGNWLVAEAPNIL